MAELRAWNGGCLHVQLDQNFREMMDMYNNETYRFSDLHLFGCLAKKDGGAIFVKNVQKMEIKGKDTRIYKAYAFGSGGAINFECDRIDIGKCDLVLGNINITQNKAALNGGGIYWPNVRPIFEDTRMYDNKAGLYGHNNASYPVQAIKILDIKDKFSQVVKGGGAADTYMEYIKSNGTTAANAIDLRSVEMLTRNCSYPFPNHQANCTQYESL